MDKTKKLILWSIFAISIALFLQMFLLVSLNNPWITLIDNNISVFLSNHRVRFFDYVFVIISYLGETKVIFIFCILLALFSSRKDIGLPLTFITILSGAINLTIKIIVARTRPEGFFLTNNIVGYSLPDGYSFPSGHSQTANIFYFSLCLLTLKKLNSEKLKRFVLIFTSIFCFLMSFGRIYLGVHYFSDVFAGFCLMIAILSISILLYSTHLKLRLNIYKPN